MEHLTAFEPFKEVTRRVWLTSVQYGSDPVQFVPLNEEHFCNPHSVTTFPNAVIPFCNVTGYYISHTDGVTV
jgi:hypothetical protein